MLYKDEETGRAINTHSMLRCFRRCPKQTEYKYVQRLKPRVASQPLKRGTWMHSQLEEHYKGNDWREKHAELTREFADLFDEEKEKLGDLPRECARLMKSYLWHYGESDPWTVHEVELTLETDFPDGSIYRGRIDLLVENQFGLWIVDHKTHKTLPNQDFRILDAASALYIWAAIRNKIPVQGFIWNYIRTKAPSVPKGVYMNSSSPRLSKSAIDTDYLSTLRGIKEAGLEVKDYRERLLYLKSQRFRDGEPQSSPFFRRNILEKNDDMLKRIAQEALHTSKRMNAYPWDKVGHIERVPDNSCTYFCSYTDLCTLSLLHGDDAPGVRNLLKQRYSVADPLEYYQDDKGLGERGDQ